METAIATLLVSYMFFNSFGTIYVSVRYGGRAAEEFAYRQIILLPIRILTWPIRTFV